MGDSKKTQRNIHIDVELGGRNLSYTPLYLDRRSRCGLYDILFLVTSLSIPRSHGLAIWLVYSCGFLISSSTYQVHLDL